MIEAAAIDHITSSLPPCPGPVAERRSEDQEFDRFRPNEKRLYVSCPSDYKKDDGMSIIL